MRSIYYNPPRDLESWDYEVDYTVNENFILDMTSVISDYHNHKLDCSQVLESLLSIYDDYKQKVVLQKEEYEFNKNIENHMEEKRRKVQAELDNLEETYKEDLNTMLIEYCDEIEKEEELDKLNELWREFKERTNKYKNSYHYRAIMHNAITLSKDRLLTNKDNKELESK